MKNIDIKYSYEEGNLFIKCELLDDKYLGKTGEINLIYSTFEKGSNRYGSGTIVGKENIAYSKYFEVKFEINKDDLTYEGEEIYIGYKVDFYISKVSSLVLLEENIIDSNIFPNNLKISDFKNISLNEDIKLKDKYNILKSILSFPLIGKIYFLFFSILIFLFSYFVSYVFGIISFIALIYFSLFVFNLSYIKVEFIQGDLYDGKSLSSIYKGKANLKLENILIEVYVVNIEKTELYHKGKSYYINKIVNSIKIFSKKIDVIQKNDNIENYLSGQINFNEIYEKLLPPIMSNGEDGLALKLVLKVTHNDFMDYKIENEIYLDKDKFKIFKQNV